MAASDLSTLTLPSSNILNSPNVSALENVSLTAPPVTTISSPSGLGGGNELVDQNGNPATMPAIPSVTPATPAASIAANQNTSTGSKFGSSAGVSVSQNQTASTAAAASATTPSSTVTPATDTPDAGLNITDTSNTNNTNTTSTDTTSGGTTSGGTTQQIDPSTLTDNANTYLTQQTAALKSQLDDATTQANNDYATSYSQLQAEAQQQIQAITLEMNQVVSGTQASLLAQNPYSSPSDPNISGYVNEIQNRYQEQIETVQANLLTGITGLQGTLNDALSKAKTSYDSAIGNIQSNAQTMSDSESNQIASKQDTEQTKFYTALKNFTAPSDISSYTTQEALADPTIGPIMQLAINGGMSADQALATIQNQSAATQQPGMSGSWDSSQDMTAQLGLTGLTYGAVDNAATELNATGKMPSLGLGSGNKGSAAAARQAVLNRAYVLNPNGPAVVAEQAYIKASTTEAVRSASLLGPTQAAADKANAQIGIVQSLANKVNFGSDIVLNQSTMMFEAKVGSTNPQQQALYTQYANAMNTLVNEYGKVLSGNVGASGLTDSARASAADSINSYMSNQSVTAALNLIGTEMDFTIRGYQNSINATTANISNAAATGTATGSNTAITVDPNNTDSSDGNTVTTTSTTGSDSAWGWNP